VVDRRFIEEAFPVKEISEESAVEKSVRHGHISTLHIWWARRPLASSRATNYSALIGAPKSPADQNKVKEFVIKLSQWNSSLDQDLMEKARGEVLRANKNSIPKVLDPFAGGGSIPLEAMRLGCETYASDYNPVATLILKCTIEYPQKYGRSMKSKQGLVSPKSNRLLEDVRKWGYWVSEKARKELGSFYPHEDDGATPVAYMWARVIPCQNPACNGQIPLMRQFWLARSETKKVSLFPFSSRGVVKFKVVGTGYEKMPLGFDPEKGTVSKAVATCLLCGSVVDGKTTRRLFLEGKASQRMIAAIFHTKGTMGKFYRPATEDDMSVFQKAELQLDLKRKRLQREWGLDPVPDEPTPEGKGRGAERAFSIRNYNLNTWGDLFNSRQKLTLLTFVEKVREAFTEMAKEGYPHEYARAIASYLALGIDRLVDYGSVLCVLNPTGGRGVKNSFSRQTIQMVWDYAESNPFNPEGAGWDTACEKNEKWIEHASMIKGGGSISVTQASATSIPFPDGYFDAVFTDPPYYDNVPYSYLSDFFYVWLKRSVGSLYPDLFATPLSPKKEEAVAYSNMEGGFQAGTDFFEEMLGKSFKEIDRVLKPNGISLIVYAHRSTAGWETMINSLLDSGLVVTGAWPLRTEKRGRLRSQESAALASSIYMIARKFQKLPTGFYNEVRQELRTHLHVRLDKIWEEGIGGADFLISAIGFSIEVFGKYEKIIDDEGNTIRADRMLEDVRRIVTDYAVRQVLHNGFAEEISPMTRFYVLWRWAFGDAKIDFDDAKKLAQSVGIDMPKSGNKGFIKKDKEFVQVLGPDERDVRDLDNSRELIDVLQRVLLLWKRGLSEEITRVLAESGFGRSEAFYRVAQAVSESLPTGSAEKKLLEGFVAGSDKLKADSREESNQARLFE
jgi:adenine-specific DNA methylase